MSGTLYWLKKAMAQRRAHRLRARMRQRAHDLMPYSTLHALMLMRAVEASRGSRIRARRLTEQWERERHDMDDEATADEPHLDGEP